jgi:hypothetical protein
LKENLKSTPSFALEQIKKIEPSNLGSTFYAVISSYTFILFLPLNLAPTYIALSA